MTPPLSHEAHAKTLFRFWAIGERSLTNIIHPNLESLWKKYNKIRVIHKSCLTNNILA